MRLMTERDYTLLLQLRDLAHALDDQISAICDAVGNLVGVKPDDDEVTDLIHNRGDVDAFRKGVGFRVVRNGVTDTTQEEPK